MSVSHKPKVFVIDDSKGFCTYMRILLRKNGIESSTFNNAQDALDQIEEQDPFLLLIDWNMPEMSGDELLIRISEETLFGDRLIYMITGEQLTNDKAFSLKSLGIAEIFNKPFDEQDLISKILAALPLNEKAA